MSHMEIMDKLEESDDENFDIFGEGTKSIKVAMMPPSGIQEPGVQERPVGTLHPKASLKPKTGEVVVGTYPTLTDG